MFPDLPVIKSERQIRRPAKQLLLVRLLFLIDNFRSLVAMAAEG